MNARISFLRRDWELAARVEHREPAHTELVAARRARVGPHRAGHLERRLLRQMIGEREHLGGDVALRQDALDRAGAVAHLEEVDLAARPPGREPATQRDRLPRVLSDPLHGPDRHAVAIADDRRP